jgi:RNA polymerase sigma-70 factor (ECF subfamily)
MNDSRRRGVLVLQMEAVGAMRRAHAEREAREAISRRRRFENLLDRHEARLRRVAYGMLGDPHRVDDVLQEAFLKAYSHLPDTFADDRHESAWLFRIVHRCCLDELRRRRRRPEVVATVERGGEDDNSLVVAGALAELNERERAVVLLVDLIGFDYDTAALALRVPRGTIASRLNAARARLREVFDGSA